MTKAATAARFVRSVSGSPRTSSLWSRTRIISAPRGFRAWSSSTRSFTRSASATMFTPLEGWTW
jgi:hypothetical protein